MLRLDVRQGDLDATGRLWRRRLLCVACGGRRPNLRGEVQWDNVRDRGGRCVPPGLGSTSCRGDIRVSCLGSTVLVRPNGVGSLLHRAEGSGSSTATRPLRRDTIDLRSGLRFAVRQPATDLAFPNAVNFHYLSRGPVARDDANAFCRYPERVSNNCFDRGVGPAALRRCGHPHLQRGAQPSGDDVARRAGDNLDR
jgi:hypothetical protein